MCSYHTTVGIALDKEDIFKRLQNHKMEKFKEREMQREARSTIEAYIRAGIVSDTFFKTLSV